MMNTTKYLSRPKSLDSAFPWILALLAVAYVAFHWSNPMTPFPDSGGYIEFSPVRTAGYPVFIDAVEAVFGSVDAVPKVQLVIAAAAVAFLGWSIFRAFGTVLFALAPVAMLMLFPQIPDAHGGILTESLFISLLCALAGCVALTTRRPTWYWIAAAALACGLAIAIRPAGVSLLIVWPLLFWLIWRRCDGRRMAALALAAIVPIAFCLIVESVLWRAYHDSESRPNLSYRHLFAKALIIESEPSLSDPELARVVSMGREVMAPGRELIAAAPSHYARTRLLVDFEVAAQHSAYRGIFQPGINAIAEARGIDEYDVLGKVIRPAMLSAPVAWFKNALAHYLGLWFPYWAYISPEILAEYQAYIQSAEPASIFEYNPIFFHKEPPGATLALLLRLTLGAGLLVSTLTVGLAAWQRFRKGEQDGRLIAAAVCGLAIHAHFLTVGLLGVVATRYAGAMAPLLAVCGILLASWVIEYARSAAGRFFARHRSSVRGGNQ